MDTGFSPSVIACFTAISILPLQLRRRAVVTYNSHSSKQGVRFSCWTHSWCFHSLLLSPSWLFSFPPLNNMLKFSGWSWWRDGLKIVCLLWSGIEACPLNASWPFCSLHWWKHQRQKTTCKLLFSFLKWSFSFPFLSLFLYETKKQRQPRDGTLFSFLSPFPPPLSLILSKLSLLTVLAQTIRPCIQKLQLMSHFNILFIPFHILLRSSS